MAEQLGFTMPYAAEGGNPPGTVDVTMSVESGEILSISGSLNGQPFQGSLHFTTMGGGGPCIVCGPPPMMCHPVNPCPDDGGGG